MNINKIKSLIYSSDIGQRMAKGAFWSLTGSILAKFIVLVAGIICARILGKEEYGEFGMVRSTINMFVIFGTAGLGITATKYISEYLRTNKEKIASIYILTNGFAVFTGLLISIIIFFIAPSLSEKTLNAPHLSSTIQIGSILLFFTVIDASQYGTLAGVEDFKSIAINTLLGSIGEGIFMIIGAYLYGVKGAIIGFGLGFIIIFISNYHSIKKNFKNFNITISLNKFNKNDLHLLYKFSLPAALSSFLVTPVLWISKSILINNDGFSELALYEVADQWKVIILFIPSAVTQIVLPILSSISSNNTNAQFLKILKLNILLNGGISFIICIIITIISPYILMLYGSSYNNIWPLVILCLSTIFTSTSNVIGVSISSKSKVWVGFIFNLIWGILTITFAYLFIHMGLGATGLSLSILITYFIHSIIQYLYLKIAFNL